MATLALRALALAAALAAAGVVRAQPAGDAAPDPAAEQRRALEAARGTLDEAERRRERVAAEIETLKGERGKLQAALIDAAASLREKQSAVHEREARIGELGESERQLRVSLVARRHVLAEVIAALQRMGRQPPPALLVRPNDALEAIRSAMLLGAVVPGMRAEAEALSSDLRELVRLRSMLSEERDRLARKIVETESEQERLSALVDERQRQAREREADLSSEAAKVANAAREIGDLESLIVKMEAEQAARAAAEAEQAARVLAEAERKAEQDKAAAAAQAAAPAAPGRIDLAALGDVRRLAPAAPFEKMRGMLPMPVSGARLRSFGDSASGGGAEKGLSISAHPGAPVTAPCDGWVVYAGPFRSYGQLLILNAGGGYHVLLAGMERITVGLNQFVLAGEPVATMRGDPAHAGKSPPSSSTRPVLYVEFRKDRGSIDPSPWWAGTAGEKAGG